jgi:amino-acid N-acetyltransferase
VTGDVRLREAGEGDLGDIRQLLERHALPTADLADSRPTFVVARAGSRLVAAGGFEAFGASALLRSVVVDESHRGTGLGRALVGHLERVASGTGIVEFVLLTETARDFFERLGYRGIAREEAPEGVRRSAEFRTLCPSSARCMQKRIGRNPGPDPG